MAERTYKRPREFFGVGSKPLLGSENPMISDSVQQRFNRAGLGSFVPYVDPFETVAKTRALRNMDRDIRLQDQVEDAEMGFMEAIRQDPKTGYQKFLQSNPMATLSPMVRAYAATQGRSGDTQSKREEQVAELGAPYLQTYRKGLKGGKDEIEAFADAVSQREQDLAKSKALKPGEDDRLTLTGAPRDEFDSIMSGIASAPEPTDEEKMAFLPPGKKEYTPAEWSDAYTKAKEKSRADAISKLRNFQQIYGQSYQVPGVPRGAFSTPSPQAQAPYISPWPTAAPTSFGEPQLPAPTVSAAPVQQVPVSAPTKRATEFNFPTLGDDLPPTPLESTVQAGKTAASNVASNIAFDPVGSLRAVASPGGITSLAIKAAPTTQEQEKAWTDAKQIVRDYINSLPGDDEQKAKMFGSLLTEQDVPNDAFFPKKLGANTRIQAGKAIEQGLKLFSGKKLGDSALQDAEGVRGWSDVAKVVAQEEMAKRGLVKTPASPSASQPSQVTTRTQYDALPSGTRYVDSNGRVAVKK